MVGILIGVKLATGAGSPKSGTKATAAQQQVIKDATTVPASVLDAIGAGTMSDPPTALTGAPLTANGKPRFLYVGAEYCPYCATERWAVVIALSRFGSFSGLGQTASSPSDVYPSTATFTFHGASYTSKYLSFTGKEEQSNQVVNGRYTTLDTLSSADQKIVSSLGVTGIPIIDIGGKYLVSGAEYDPQVLQGKTHAQIASALSDPASAIAKGADGAANVLTAAICASTDNKPANVCTSDGVVAASAKLGNG